MNNTPTGMKLERKQQNEKLQEYFRDLFFHKDETVTFTTGVKKKTVILSVQEIEDSILIVNWALL